MSNKYTPEKLQEMSRVAITARNENDMRYLELCAKLSMVIHIDIKAVNREIEKLANL